MSYELPHDNKDMEDEHFALVMAKSLIKINVVPDKELCERWLKNNWVTELELEQILEMYELLTELQ